MSGEDIQTVALLGGAMWMVFWGGRDYWRARRALATAEESGDRGQWDEAAAAEILAWRGLWWCLLGAVLIPSAWWFCFFR